MKNNENKKINRFGMDADASILKTWKWSCSRLVYAYANVYVYVYVYVYVGRLH
jgi:hypothetical protein